MEASLHGESLRGCLKTNVHAVDQINVALDDLGEGATLTLSAVPKYSVLTTHAGRRTFIVNALRLGIPAPVIMEWTGHSDYKAMKPNIKIVNAAKAENMERFNSFDANRSNPEEEEKRVPKKVLKVSVNV